MFRPHIKNDLQVNISPSILIYFLHRIYDNLKTHCVCMYIYIVCLWVCVCVYVCVCICIYIFNCLLHIFYTGCQILEGSFIQIHCKV